MYLHLTARAGTAMTTPIRRRDPYTYGGSCPACLGGREWTSPDGNSIWFCDEHEAIISDTPGWWPPEDS